jgi:hypothetical protein
MDHVCEGRRGKRKRRQQKHPQNEQRNQNAWFHGSTFVVEIFW